MRQNDLDAKRPVRNVVELKRAELVDRGHPHAFLILQQTKPRALGKRVFVARKDLADHLALSKISENLDVDIKVFGAQHELPGIGSAACPGKRGLRKTVEYKRRNNLPHGRLRCQIWLKNRTGISQDF